MGKDHSSHRNSCILQLLGTAEPLLVFDSSTHLFALLDIPLQVIMFYTGMRTAPTILDLFGHRAFRIRGGKLGYRRQLPAENVVLGDVME
jgi:hypothetical protein